MTLILAAVLIGKLIYDGITTFFAQVAVASYNPYIEYRKYMDEHQPKEDK